MLVTFAAYFVTDPPPRLYGLVQRLSLPYMIYASTPPKSGDKHNTMATDYDAPRVKEEDQHTDSLEGLKAQQRGGAMTAVIDVEESDAIDGFDLPGADLSGEELLIKVVPPQADEFTCMSCFLVRHRSQIAREKNGEAYCVDCEG